MRTESPVVRGEGAAVLDHAHMKRSWAKFLQFIPEQIFNTVTRLLALRPGIRYKTCVTCGVCARTCPQEAIQWQASKRRYFIDNSRCILCYCCAESCPYKAIEVKPFRYRLFRRP